MSLQWMYWTLPTAIFFIAIFVTLAAMTIWQTLSPSIERRGLLPIPTTPGDRLFIGIITSFYIYLAWLGFTHWSLWIAFPIGLGWIMAVMCWG